MEGLTREQSASRERTLLTSLLLSAPGPLVTGLALLGSQSSTQFADFIRRGIELAAIFLSWWVFHKLVRSPEMGAAQQSRMERAVGLGTATAMCISGVILTALAVARLSDMTAGGRVGPGLIIAILGVLTNGWFWRRYAGMTREQYSAVIAAQEQLYRAKTFVDVCVMLALGAVFLAPAHPVTRYVDLVGSIIVALYLLWSGFRSARKHLGGEQGLRPASA